MVCFGLVNKIAGVFDKFLTISSNRPKSLRIFGDFRYIQIRFALPRRAKSRPRPRLPPRATRCARQCARCRRLMSRHFDPAPSDGASFRPPPTKSYRSIVTQIAAVFNAFCKNSVLTFSHEMSIFSQNYLFDVNFLTLAPLQDLLAACIRAKSTTYRLTAVKMLLPRAHFSAIIISNVKSADAVLTKKGTSAFKIRPFCSIFSMKSKENTYPVTGADMPPTGTMRMRLGTHTIAPSPPSIAGI